MAVVKLNDDQQKLIKQLSKFWKSNDQKVFLLAGQAGVGKTTCVRYFLDMIQTSSVCLTAPTNKAVKVLKTATNDDDLTYKTIYSLLGLTMQANGAVKELADTGKEAAGTFSLIVIDEGSMLPEIVLRVLYKKTALTNTKILIIGDNEQLPPVGAEESPIWSTYETAYELTEVMRHQNSILTFVQSIRGNKSPVFKSPGEEVSVLDESEFIEDMLQSADAGLFHSGQAKAIAWRNMTVDFLNKLIRNRTTKSKELFVSGDRVIFTAPMINENKAVIVSTDEEGVVISCSKDYHPKHPEFRILALDVKTETGEFVVAKLIDPADADKLSDKLKSLSEKKNWREFWSLKEAFNTVSYAYAITAHRSQGSTFERVYIDAGDIMLNHDEVTRTKCLYVGCSRASKNLIIFP